MPTSSLDALRRRLSPVSRRAPSPVSAELSEQLGVELGDAVERRFDQARTVLERAEAHVTFGGHFSSGKSTLINALLGRPVLPVSDFPETGVQCAIRTGARDTAAAVVRRGEGVERVELDLSADEIGRYTALIGDDGDVRAIISDVTQLQLTVGSCDVIPPEVVWIDSPGLNDSAAMTARAAAAADHGDVLVWVVNSRQMLSELEQRFLAAHLDRRGPESVVFVVNAFLRHDTHERWIEFHKRIEPACRTRIRSFFESATDGRSKPLIAVTSARGASGQPNADFGIRQTAALLGALTVDSAQVRAVRTVRVLDALNQAEAALCDRLLAERQRVAALTAISSAADDEARAAFERVVRGIVRRALQSFTARANAAATAVAAEIERPPLHRDGHYGARLTSALAETACTVANELFREVTTAAKTHRRHVEPDLSATLAALLVSGSLTVTVPQAPVTKGSRGAGAVIGGIVGSLFLPGAGTAIGAAIGAGMGNDSNQAEALAADRVGAKQSLDAELARATALVVSREPQVVAAVTDTTALAPPQPPNEADRLEQAINDLQQELVGLTRAALTEALRDLAVLPAPRSVPSVAAG